MTRYGIAILNGRKYTLYEQKVDSFYRLDICEEGANFHVEVDKVKFSMVRKKDVFFYGDRDLYERYKCMMDVGKQFNVPEKVEHSWKLGNYCTDRVRETNDGEFAERIEQINGKLHLYAVRLRDEKVEIMTMSEYDNAKLQPINFSDYIGIDLQDNNVTNNASYYSLAELRVRYDIEHLYANDFVVALDLETARARLKACVESDSPLIGIDTETTGKEVNRLEKDRMVGIILSHKYGEATYFPFGHKEFDNLSREFLQEELMPAIAKEQWRMVAHNKKFERKVFLHEGWDIRIKYDTLPLSCVVNPIIAKGVHELKTLMQEETGLKYLELKEIFKNPKLIDFTVLPLEIVRLYACPDASSLLRLFPSLWAKLPVESQFITNIEFELADIKADQEYYGLRVDVNKFMKNLDNCDYMIDELLSEFRGVTGIDGNVNSNVVLSDLLYGKLRCPVLVRTKKTGQPSTGKASIEKLASKISSDRSTTRFTKDIVDKNGAVIVAADRLNIAQYPPIMLLQQYRLYNKLRTSFYNRFERTGNGGRIFFWINQNGTASGRQSSPMHQLPSELKEDILSDSPDHDMWDPDYSQIELRGISFLAGETSLIELSKDPENDIHRAIGSLINNCEMWEISDADRSAGKRRNFGVIYEISKWGLAAQQAGAGYTEEDTDKAGKSLDEFFHRFKRVKKYINKNALKVKRDGKIATYWHRYRYFPEVFDPNITSKELNSVIRKANNLPVQGTAADYMKIAEVNIGRYIRNKGWDVIMPNGFPRVRDALSIHDEIIIMADRSIPYEEIMLMMRECMEIEVKGAPPFFCEPALVDNWKQHTDSSVSMPVKLRDKLIEEYQKTNVSQLNKENYKQVINNYRDSRLSEYMDDLVERYGPDTADIAAHVRHPSLTHELIKRYSAPEELNLSHIENIHYAVIKYMKGEPTLNEVKRTKDEYISNETLVNFDSSGEAVYEEEYEDDDDEEVVVSEDDGLEEYLTQHDKCRVWEFQDAFFVDISGMSKKGADLVIRKVWEARQDDGFYEVRLIYNDRILKPGFRVEDMDSDALEEYIKEVENE